MNDDFNFLVRRKRNREALRSYDGLNIIIVSNNPSGGQSILQAFEQPATRNLARAPVQSLKVK